MFQSLHSDPEKSNMPGDAVSPSDTVSTFSTVTSPHDIEKKPLPHVIERPIERLDSNTAAIVEVEAPAKKRSHLSLFRVGPLAGLAALALALLLLFASFTILMVSDGQATDRWHEPWVPTVWLAIFTAVSNKLIAFAAIQGVVVLWWRRATRGATLKQLHTDWSYGLHAWKALFAGRQFNILALACLCATFVAIDGPLLQRASRVHLAVPHDSSLNLSVAITPELPAYWSGGWVFDASQHYFSESSKPFHDVVEEVLASKTISGAIAGCADGCSATVLAPALATYACKTDFTYRNFSAPLHDKVQEAYENAMNFGIHPSAPDSRVVYAIQTYIAANSPPDSEWFVLQTMMSDKHVTNTCTGSVNWTSCALVSAIAEYEIQIDNGVITFADQSALSSPKIVALANNTGITPEIVEKKGLLTKMGYTRTTLSGILNVAAQKFSTISSILPAGAETGPKTVNSQMKVMGVDVNAWWAMQHTTNWERFSDGVDCAPNWIDPRDEIMAFLNQVMFRTGVYTARRYSDDELKPMLDEGVGSHTVVTGQRTKPTTFYKSNMSYFGGAAALQIFSVLVILYTFYGWWSFGWRSGSVSFSPLELAKAFDAPLLRDIPSDLNGSRIANLENGRQVQYGVVSMRNDSDPEKGFTSTKAMMAFERPDQVEPLGGTWSWRNVQSFIRSGNA